MDGQDPELHLGCLKPRIRHAQEVEKLTHLPDRAMTVIPGPEVLLTLSPLEAVAMSVTQVWVGALALPQPAAFQQD